MKPGVCNFESEKPGMRYGKRVVLRPDVLISGGNKHRALWVRCDCGREDLVYKSQLVNRRAEQCLDCKSRAKSEEMTRYYQQKREAEASCTEQPCTSSRSATASTR